MGKVNQKVIKALGKLIEQGFDTEKAISTMTLDDMLLLPGINIAELALFNEIQKAVRANQIITFIAGYEKEGGKNGEI